MAGPVSVLAAIAIPPNRPTVPIAFLVSSSWVAADGDDASKSPLMEKVFENNLSLGTSVLVGASTRGVCSFTKALGETMTPVFKCVRLDNVIVNLFRAIL